MKAPQIILVTLYSVSLLINAYQHGKPKAEKGSIWRAFIGTGLMIGLLIWGGFFK